MYVVEGKSASIQIIRDSRSTYMGALLVDYYPESVEDSAQSDEDYSDSANTSFAFFNEGQMSVDITISTLPGGGITIDGVELQISGLETAETFNMLLRNIRATPADGTEDVFPYRCIPGYFITDFEPEGILENSETTPYVPKPVLILDKPGDVSVSFQGSCTLKNVHALLKCTDDDTILEIQEVEAPGDGATLLEVFNKSSGALIDTVPVANLPVEIDVKDHFNEFGFVEVMYQACGCCIEKSYSCTCTILSVEGELICCNIAAVDGELVCCEITEVEGELSCG